MEKTAVILSHLYVIELKIVLRDSMIKFCRPKFGHSSQRTNDIETTSYRRLYDIITPHKRPYDAISSSCAC